MNDPPSTSTEVDSRSQGSSRLPGQGAIEAMLKFGIGTKNELELVSPEVSSCIERMVKLIASRETWEANDLLDRLQTIWR